jgi:hypothetical protein
MNRLAAIGIDARTLRSYAPLVMLVVTIAAGWTVFIRPVSADQRRALGQLASLRERETTLRRDVGQPSPLGIDVDPAVTFERQVASGDAAPALLEQLARLASEARARNLLIETVEPGQTAVDATPQARPGQAGHDGALQRDPRLALFEVRVSHVPIRVAFDTDFASLGGFLWAFRNLPTTVEIRALSIGLPPADAGAEEPSPRADALRVSLTLHAYSRPAAAIVHAANTVTR